MLTLWAKEEDDGMACSYLVLIFDENGLVNHCRKPFNIGHHTFYGPVVLCSFKDSFSCDGNDETTPIDVTQEDFDNLVTLVNKRMGYE